MLGIKEDSLQFQRNSFPISASEKFPVSHGTFEGSTDLPGTRSHVSTSLVKVMRQTTEKLEGNVSLICPAVLESQKSHAYSSPKDYWQFMVAEGWVSSSVAKPLTSG